MHTLTSFAPQTMGSQIIHSVATMFISMWLTQESSKPVPYGNTDELFSINFDSVTMCLSVSIIEKNRYVKKEN